MKNFKKIISFLLLSCALFSVIALNSCNNGNTGDNGDNGNIPEAPTKNDNLYTVNIVDQDNNPVSGVSVIFDPGFATKTSDANGKITIETENQGLKFMITTVPDGYTKPAAVEAQYHGVFGDKKELTVTVTKKTEVKVTYSVKVIDQNGNAVDGVLIQLCPNGVCLSDSFVTASNGTITKDMEPNLPVDVKLVTVPDGYTKPEAIDANGYHAKIAAGETEVTVVITRN